jgi:7-cyano-7-deazaguanine synthase
MRREVQVRTAVLVSGGLDSSVLLASVLQLGGEVTPLHVRCGLAWEVAEGRALSRLLAHAPFAGIAAPLVTLTAIVQEAYPPDHWAMTGHPPAFDTPDVEVYLEGRNLILLTTAALWCRRRGVTTLAIGSLDGNPFPDATPDFFRAASHTLSVGLGCRLEVVAPLLSLHKEDVVRLGHSLGVPLALTLSCMNPGDGDRPCHACSKCRERLGEPSGATTASGNSSARASHRPGQGGQSLIR